MKVNRIAFETRKTLSALISTHKEERYTVQKKNDLNHTLIWSLYIAGRERTYFILPDSVSRMRAPMILSPYSSLIRETTSA